MMTMQLVAKNWVLPDIDVSVNSSSEQKSTWAKISANTIMTVALSNEACFVSADLTLCIGQWSRGRVIGTIWPLVSGISEFQANAKAPCCK